MAQEQLPDEVKSFIVQALACYDRPSVVVKAVKDEFDLVVSPQQVQAYDPEKTAGHGLSQRWRELFAATRKAMVDGAAEVPIAHRVVRLRTLHRMSTQAEGMRNYALAAQLLEQAAKECGNAYTNRRELTGKDGADLPPAVSIFALPDNGRDPAP